MSVISFCPHISVLNQGSERWNDLPGNCSNPEKLSLPLPLNDTPVVIEMAGEQDDNYVKYQMSIQTGLKWPKDRGVCRWNCYCGSQRETLTCLFQMENKNGPEVTIICPWNINAIWKGLNMLCNFCSWDISCIPFVHVRQIEGKVVEISRLQEIFAEKVLHQVSGVPPSLFTWTLLQKWCT